MKLPYATRLRFGQTILTLTAATLLAGLPNIATADQPTSYAPVVIHEDFDTIVARMKEAKPEIEARQTKLLEERYDLSDRPAKGVTMSRGKPIQEGVRAKLPAGVKSWEDLAAMTPEEIREKGLWPKGFLPLPHPNHPEGGMVFPQVPHRQDQEAGGPRPDPLRPRLRPADALPARVSAADLPDDAARPGRRVARARWSTLSNYFKTVQRHPEPQAAGGLAAAGDAVPAAAVQRHRRPPLAEAEPGRGLLRLPRQRPHQRAPRTWSATSGRRSSATGSTRRRCAA